MKNKKTNSSSVTFSVARYLAFCAIIVGIALLCVCHAGCQITSEGIKVLNASESPEIAGVKLLDEHSLEVRFTKEVSVKSATVSKLDAGQDASIEQIGQDAEKADAVVSEDGKTVVYYFAQSTTVGQRYQLFSEIKDSRGNTLTFALPFEGFNSRIPIVVLEEIFWCYSGKDNICEYITLRALSDGNIGGIEIFSAKQKTYLSKYQLPAVEVKSGEYITIHMRTFEGQNVINELDGDITKSAFIGSSNKMRDLYFENTKKCVSDICDVILLRNKSTMEIMDALLYTVKTEKTTFEKYSDVAQTAVEKNKWKSSDADYEPFLLEKKSTAKTKSLRRKNSAELLNLAQQGKLTQSEIASSKDDWTIGESLYSSNRK